MPPQLTFAEIQENDLRRRYAEEGAQVRAAGGDWCDFCANLRWVKPVHGGRLVPCPVCTGAATSSPPTQHWTERKDIGGSDVDQNESEELDG